MPIWETEEGGGAGGGGGESGGGGMGGGGGGAVGSGRCGGAFGRLRSFCPQLREVHDRLGGRPHVGDAHPLALRVVLLAAGEDVRRRQPELGEARPVRAAPDELPDRLEPPAAG